MSTIRDDRDQELVEAREAYRRAWRAYEDRPTAGNLRRTTLAQARLKDALSAMDKRHHKTRMTA